MKNIIISTNSSGTRIDKFLAKEFFSYSRGEIIRQIRAGNILVNGKTVKPSYVLKENDELKIALKNISELIPNKDIKLEIIYEDKNIIAVNKPAGLQVHPDHHEKNNTLVNGLIFKFPEIKNVGDDSFRPGIIHRLDKDTSGVMIIARNQKAFEELKKKFKNREMEKAYLAIVVGRVSESGRLGKSGETSGVINKPLARSSSYRKQVVAGRKTKTKVREAITEYKILKEYDNYSLLEVLPKTGRMHQIRVHLASIGHPVAGDKLYKLKNIKNLEQSARQMLHAKNIKLTLNDKLYSFSAEVPEDFDQFLDSI